MLSRKGPFRRGACAEMGHTVLFPWLSMLLGHSVGSSTGLGHVPAVISLVRTISFWALPIQSLSASGS